MKTLKNLLKTPKGDLFTRLTTLINAIGSIENFEDIEKDVPWNEVNTYLFSSLNLYDYNIFCGRITSLRDLNGLLNDMKMSICGMGFWRKETCKDCGKVFYLTKEQIDDFVAKDYFLPKRCPKCQKVNRKKKARRACYQD